MDFSFKKVSQCAPVDKNILLTSIKDNLQLGESETITIIIMGHAFIITRSFQTKFINFTN